MSSEDYLDNLLKGMGVPDSVTSDEPVAEVFTDIAQEVVEEVLEEAPAEPEPEVVMAETETE